MSDKVELIAAAQVDVVGGSPGSITFNSNFGFKTASRGTDGSYELTLDDKHDAKKLVVNVTRDALTDGSIQASVPASGDTRTIMIAAFDTDGVAADASFFITVYRVRS